MVQVAEEQERTQCPERRRIDQARSPDTEFYPHGHRGARGAGT